MTGACFRCEKYGHYAWNCPDKRKWHSAKKAELVPENCQPDKEETDQSAQEDWFTFNSLEIVASVNSIKTPYATNEQMMTKVRLEGVCDAVFECDTAASHSVISMELCEKLQKLADHRIIVMN